MKITIPYNVIHDKNDGQFNADLKARYSEALALGVVASPVLGEDDVLRVELLNSRRIKPSEAVAIVGAGGEVEGAEIYAKVVSDNDCLLSEDSETWGEWLTAQYPHIVTADPEDGYLYFCCRDGGGAWSGSKLKQLADASISLLTRAEYQAANPIPENP